MSKKMKASGFLAKSSLVAVFLLIAIGGLAQSAEVGIVKGVIDVAATKDFVWITSFVAAMSVVLNFYLVRLMFGMVEKHASIVVKNTEVLQKVCDATQDCNPRHREKRYDDETPTDRR
jgi:hypothetical protein